MVKQGHENPIMRPACHDSPKKILFHEKEKREQNLNGTAVE